MASAASGADCLESNSGDFGAFESPRPQASRPGIHDDRRSFGKHAIIDGSDTDSEFSGTDSDDDDNGTERRRGDGDYDPLQPMHHSLPLVDLSHIGSSVSDQQHPHILDGPQSTDPSLTVSDAAEASASLYRSDRAARRKMSRSQSMRRSIHLWDEDFVRADMIDTVAAAPNPWALESLVVLMDYFVFGLYFGMSTTPLTYYLVEHLDASPAQVVVVLGVQHVPRALQFVLGLVSDLIPIGGRRRKPYIFGGYATFIAAHTALFLLRTPTAPQLAAALFIANMGLLQVGCGQFLSAHIFNFILFSFLRSISRRFLIFLLQADVSCDAVMVERSKDEVGDAQGSLQVRIIWLFLKRAY